MTVISFENPELTGTYAVLLSNRTDWSAKKILATYLQRWPIETFYQERSGHLGLDKYRMRSELRHSKTLVSGLRSLFNPAPNLFTAFTLCQVVGNLSHNPSKPLGRSVVNRDRS